MPNFSLALTEADLRVIAAGLNDLPYRIAAPVMDKLKAQVEEQRKQVHQDPLPPMTPQQESLINDPF